MRRVVITGMGLVTPLGCGVKFCWDRLVAGDSGIRPITDFDTSDLPSTIAGLVPKNDGPHSFKADDYMDPKEQRRMDEFIHFALAAATEAIEDSNWKPQTTEEFERTGVMVGSGIGGLRTIEAGALTLAEKGPRRLSPFFIPSCLINLASGQISIRFGFKGPNHSVVTACSTGAHAIGDAARIIMLSDADVMIAGGAESPVTRLGVAGFCAARALSTNFNQTPTRASRPWDRDRDGFVMGEGAGVVVLEEHDHAIARGANIYGEIVGFGMSGDAHHITAPPEDGDGGFRSMRAALNRAQIDPANVDYINAHGTSTPLGDEIEHGAVQRLFGDSSQNLLMSSTKSSIGHLLGAAGAVEAIFTTLAVKYGIAPPTLNLDNPSAECDLDLVALKSRNKPIAVALSNSFGFGGTNASLVIRSNDRR
ncbi:MAG: beta-ketoacyl-ACP synthase II [Pseudomonadota bacterium]|nr:beta-ketoacyl-ACP synthase II [Pseudomonadota bacterium]